MKMMKWILIIVSACVIGYGAWSNYTHQGLFAQTFEENEKTNEPPLLIAHAGGVLRTGRLHFKDLSADINYHRSTNAKEAFEQSYAQGIRYFEGDVVFTADNQLVLRHGWGNYLYALMGQENPPNLAENTALTLDDITSRSIFKYNPVMTGAGIINFLKEQPDAFFIVDVKEKDQTGQLRFEEVLQELKNLAKNDKEILARIIPQAYHVAELERIKDIYPFPNVWLTLYQTSDSDEDIIAALKAKRVQGLVCGHDIYQRKQNLLDKVKATNVPIYINTINNMSTLEHYVDEGVAGVFTDTLRVSTKGIAPLKGAEAEKDY